MHVSCSVQCPTERLLAGNGSRVLVVPVPIQLLKPWVCSRNKLIYECTAESMITLAILLAVCAQPQIDEPLDLAGNWQYLFIRKGSCLVELDDACLCQGEDVQEDALELFKNKGLMIMYKCKDVFTWTAPIERLANNWVGN